MITVVSPPGSGGVNDYADLVARAIGGRHLSFDGIRDGAGAGPLFIQVSQYGYHPRGVAFELLQWTRRQKAAGRPVGLFFHELYASGPPWTSSFWLSPLQRHVAAALARTCDFWMTNRQASANWLLRTAGPKPHAVLPIISNVGEQPEYRTDRQPSLIVFGSSAVRGGTYRALGETVFTWAAANGITLEDIGPDHTDAALLRRLRDAGVRLHGLLDADAAGALLSTAMFGALSYPAAFVGKSGVFAAYCAHGACPVLLSDDRASLDDLAANIHYLTDLPRAEDLQCISGSIGRQAWSWYRPHALSAHAAAILRLFGSAGRC